MASAMARKMEVWVPPATSLPRPMGMPSVRYRRTGAMPEARLVLEAGQWAMNTPCCFISSISASEE